eukprot:jgi/Ulvmu1/8816/UM048_0071.1
MMWTLTPAAAVLCVLSAAPYAVRAQDCEPGFIAVGGGCRPCGDLGDLACEGTGCNEGFTVNAEGRCRPCGAFAQLVCVGQDGERFCTGDRLIVGPERCDPCGAFGQPPCLEGSPCDPPELFPAPDDGGICRPCGARFRTCCLSDTDLSPCRFDVQECIEGICLRCNVPDPDPGCPGFTDEPPPPPFTGPTPDCEAGTAPNDRGGCSPCGAFAQLVCIGEDGERFCTGDRLIVGPERCDPCGAFGQPPCLEGSPCDPPELFPAPDDGGICRPCGARFRTCCPAESGLSPCRFDFQDCVGGLCLRCDVPDPDPGCTGAVATVDDPAVGPTEMPEPAPMPEPDMMMGATGGPAPGPSDAGDMIAGPDEGDAPVPV